MEKMFDSLIEFTFYLPIKKKEAKLIKLSDFENPKESRSNLIVLLNYQFFFGLVVYN